MASKPCIVVASCTEAHPTEFIKLILGVSELPQSVSLEDGITAYDWTIDTKYYTVDVNICSIEKKTLGSEEFAMSVEAVVINFDSTRADGLDVVESWMSFLKEFEPEIQILLCDRCDVEPPNGIKKLKAQEWCIERGFELVELNPEVDVEWEEEQDFIETTGIKRVVQSLHAHLWPNLHLKGKPQQLSRNVQAMLNGGGLDDLEQQLDNVHLDNGTDNMEDRLDELLGDSGGIAGFSSLFEQLHNMKEKVSELPSDQRKACAEQVVMAFWRAIGGDEDELDGLGDSG